MSEPEHISHIVLRVMDEIFERSKYVIRSQGECVNPFYVQTEICESLIFRNFELCDYLHGADLAILELCHE